MPTGAHVTVFKTKTRKQSGGHPLMRRMRSWCRFLGKPGRTLPSLLPAHSGTLGEAIAWGLSTPLQPPSCPTSPLSASPSSPRLWQAFCGCEKGKFIRLPLPPKTHSLRKQKPSVTNYPVSAGHLLRSYDTQRPTSACDRPAPLCLSQGLLLLLSLSLLFPPYML